MAQEQGVDIADVAESGTRVSQGDGGSDGGRCCQMKQNKRKSKKKTKKTPEL